MLIGIGGVARSGKNSVANVLIKEFGYTEVSFAEELKRLCSQIYDFPINYFIDDNLKDKVFESAVIIIDRHIDLISKFCPQSLTDGFKHVGTELISPRHILQYTAHEICRTKDPDIWVKVFKDMLKTKNTAKLVCTDIRYPNERACIKELGGELWLVERPNWDFMSSHASELLIGESKDYDVIISNQSTKFELEGQIRMYVNHFLPIKRKYAKV